jgi:hypothetical protein
MSQLESNLQEGTHTSIQFFSRLIIQVAGLYMMFVYGLLYIFLTTLRQSSGCTRRDLGSPDRITSLWVSGSPGHRRPPVLWTRCTQNRSRSMGRGNQSSVCVSLPFGFHSTPNLDSLTDALFRYASGPLPFGPHDTGRAARHRVDGRDVKRIGSGGCRDCEFDLYCPIAEPGPDRVSPGRSLSYSSSKAFRHTY